MSTNYRKYGGAKDESDQKQKSSRTNSNYVSQRALPMNELEL